MPDSPNHIAGILEDSLRLHREGQLEDAKAGYLEVLRLAPDHPSALNLLGTVDAQEGRLDDAERLIRRAISNAPREAAFYTNLANVLQEQGRFPDAIQAYRLALRIDPDRTEVLNNFGALLLRAGHAAEAETCFRKVLEAEAGRPEVHNNLGRALNNQRKLDDAISAFEAAIALDPGFAAAYNNLGHVYRATGKNTHAAASFQQAIRLNPERADAYHNLGTVYMAQNMPEQAVECLREAVRKDPGMVRAYVDLGVALHGLGQLGEAVDAYRGAIEIEPRNPFSFMNLGLVLYERRNLKAAETALRQALELKPDLLDAAAELAAILDEQGRLEELGRVVEKGLAISPEHPRLNLEAARLDRRRGNPGAGIARLAGFDLKAMSPRLAQQYRYELGRLNDRHGDHELAWLHITEANRLAAESWRAYDLHPDRFLKRLDALQEFYAQSEPESWMNPPADKRSAPVFLVGFPASGSEFVSEALRRHPGLQVLDEAPTLSAVQERMVTLPGGYPGALARIDEDMIPELRGIYWSMVDGLLERMSDKMLVDHHPMRSAHAVAAWRLFPGSRFIFVKRHPADLCLANFMQDYAINEANANFLDLGSTLLVVEKVLELWRICCEKYPIAHLTLSYEALSSDPQSEVRKALDFVGLETDGAVDEFLSQARAGERATRSSYRQLADPMDPHMTGRWKHYRKQLSQHMDRLMPLAQAQGYGFD